GWYGWPDFAGGRPVTDPALAPERGPALSFLIANHAELPTPEPPLLAFEPHAAATKFDALPDGRLVVALFGDERPMTAPPGPRRGRALAFVDTSRWTIESTVAGPFERPI